MKSTWWLLSLACAACLAGAALAQTPDNSDRLPAARAIPILTQRLMDAIPGEPAVWAHYLSDSAFYVAEDGEVLGKPALIAELKPFPEGFSGSIEVKALKIVALGDLAVSTFEAHERETVYDQTIEVTYRTTHTWRREQGRWRLVASQNLVVPRDPPALPVTLGNLDAFAGTYDLSGKRRYRVERRGDDLVGGREGGALARLIPVGENVFADSGSTLGVIRIFVRGRSGAVERMVQRRKFADLDWMRVAEPTK
jgi:ketosteroid isomerase-like protein